MMFKFERETGIVAKINKIIFAIIVFFEELPGALQYMLLLLFIFGFGIVMFFTLMSFVDY